MFHQEPAAAPFGIALPDDVLEETLAFCPTSDLFQLAVTSRRLSIIANRFLYQTIPNLAPNKFTEFLMSVYFHDHNAPLVRSFTLRLQRHSTSLVEPFTRGDTYESVKKFGSWKTLSARHVLQNRFTLLAAVLKKLHNLTALRLYMGYTAGDNFTAEALLAGCSFQLRVFHSSFQLDQALVSFLQTQPSLRDLWLNFSSKPLPSDWSGGISVKVLPSLTTVGWLGLPPSMEIIRHLIGGRPVDSVVIDISTVPARGVPENPDEEPVIVKRFKDLRPCEKQIKHARIIFGNLTYSWQDINFVCTAFTSLEYLTLHFPVLAQKIFDEVVASIHHFKSMRHLVISVSESVSPIKPQDIAEKCLDKSYSLDAVQVIEHNFGRDVYRVLYQRTRFS